MAACRQILRLFHSRSTFLYKLKLDALPQTCSGTVKIYKRSFSGKSPRENDDFVDEIEGTGGVERWELLQKVKGIDDPFQLSAKTVAAGTKDKPTLIPTISNQRTVGCLCEQDTPVIKWMRLHLGETKCCECGHWFKLVPLED